MDRDGLFRFGLGDRVRVLNEEREGHIRTPWYAMGRTGLVERVQGPYHNPESLAFGGTGLPKVPVYLVKFAQSSLWQGYKGPAGDTLSMDIFEHWLEPA